MLLKGMISAEYQEDYKFVSFKSLISMFEIKKIGNTSITNSTIIMKRISTYNDKLISHDSFNSKYIETVLFEKIRSQLPDSEKYTQDSYTIMYFEWFYF
jgi:hypothetical protein